MNRWIANCLGAVLTTAALAGCNSDAYDPKMSGAELTSYAGKHQYPSDLTATQADKLVWGVGDNGVITINNLGDATLSDIQIWVNKSYVLPVTTLPTHDKRTFAPELFYNAAGQTLKDEPNKQSWTVQVVSQGKLMTANGPVKE